MSKINIAICDDDLLVAQKLEGQICEYCSSNSTSCSLQIFDTADDLLFALGDEYFDAIFLDIEIGSTSGLEIGTKIRDEMQNNKTNLVFISSHPKYHLSGQLYKATPVSFLNKPINIAEVFDAMSIIFERTLNLHMQENLFAFAFNGRKHSVLKQDILYFESHLRNKTIVTLTQRYSFNASMKQICQAMNDSTFVLVHQAFLVNVFQIKDIYATEVVMRNGDILPVSNRYQKALALEVARSLGIGARPIQ